MLVRVVLPLGVAYLTAVAVAITAEVARRRPLRAVLGDTPRILRYAALTVGILAAALWLYAEAGLIPVPPFPPADAAN